MLFSSWTFIVYFLPATLAGFALIPARLQVARKLWLIAASLFFYGYWKVEYVPLLLFSIAFNFGIAEGMIRSARPERARTLLTMGVLGNVLLLGYFKYTNFILHFLGRAADQDWGHFDIILPLAISFFTFTQISYLVDVFRDRNVHYPLLDYTFFVVFFPHLIAGPIVRHWEIIPQFSGRDFRVNRDNLGVGLTLFIFGLMKKSLADGISIYADAVFNAAAGHVPLSTLDAWLGVVSFSLQIYFDFSAYSDMAIGLARMFGIRFPYNFDSPYRAISIIGFWERWHHTLTRFLREYVYFTLGGNRRGRVRQVINIMITMFVSGLWHGAGWTYVLWGALHGVYLVINHQCRVLAQQWKWDTAKLPFRAAGAVLTFFALAVAWVFFRASTMAAAGRVLGPLLAIGGVTFPDEQFAQGGLRDHVLAPMGIHFIATKAAQVKHYDTAAELIALLLVVCWFMPNTQQLLARYRPVLEPVTRPGAFQLKLGVGLGLFLGFIAYVIIRSYYVSEPSPFIYYHF